MKFVLTETLKVLPEPDSKSFGFGSRAPQVFREGDVVDGQLLADGQHLLVANKYKIPTSAVNRHDAQAVMTEDKSKATDSNTELHELLAAAFQIAVINTLKLTKYDVRYIGQKSAKFLQLYPRDIKFFQTVVEDNTGYRPNEVDCAIIWHNLSLIYKSDWLVMTYEQCAAIADEFVSAVLAEQVT